MTEDRPPQGRIERGDEPDDADAPLTREPRATLDVHALVAAARAAEHPDVFPGEPLS